MKMGYQKIITFKDKFILTRQFFVLKIKFETSFLVTLRTILSWNLTVDERNYKLKYVTFLM